MTDSHSPHLGSTPSADSQPTVRTSSPNDRVEGSSDLSTSSCGDVRDFDEVERILAAVAQSEFSERYQLGNLLGIGANGVVFACKDLSMDLPCAIKFCLSEHAEESRARFLREGKILSGISHPNVVTVFEVGELAGCLYIILEYVDGGTLRTRLVERGRLSPAEAIVIALGCLSGLQVLHARGIVHRDLKPENVLFFTSGHIKLSDLGIAKVFGNSEVLTQTGALVGTPRYMSPEQIRGEEPVPATDLYAMGIVLFEMMTGKPPFDATVTFDLFRQHVESPPPNLDLIVEGIPKALVVAVERSLAKLPAQRHDGAESLSAELQAILNRGDKRLFTPLNLKIPDWLPSQTPVFSKDPFESLLEQRAGVGSLHETSNRRSRRPLWGLVAVMSLLMGWAVFHQYRAPTSVSSGAGSLVDRLSKTPGLDASPAGPGNTPIPPIRGILSLALSPDGSILAIGGKYGRLSLVDAVTGKMLADLKGHVDDVTTVGFTPDGTRFATGSDDRTVRVWDVKTRQQHRAKTWQGKIQSVGFSPNGRVLASAGKEDNIRFIDLAKDKELRPLRHEQGSISAVAFLPGGRFFVSIGHNVPIRIWDLTNYSVALQVPTQAQRVSDLAVSPNGRAMAFSGEDQVIRVHATETGRELRILECPGQNVSALAFSPDGRRLASGGKDRIIRVWDLGTGLCLRTFEKLEHRVNALAFTRDGRTLLSGGSEGLVRRFDAETGKELSPPLASEATSSKNWARDEGL